MRSLALRAQEAEQMDDVDLPEQEYATVLRDLARVNRWTMTARPVIKFLQRNVKKGQSFTLIDVGFGDGDILRFIAQWAQQNGSEAHLVGVDLNPRSEAIARAATPDSLSIDWRTGEYATQPEHFDYWISSQVAHHMTAQELQSFIGHMEAVAQRGWAINDLHRHRIAYLAYPWLANLLGVHEIVRQDGQLSIARSFRQSEWIEILNKAGIEPSLARLSWHFPFRICVERAR